MVIQSLWQEVQYLVVTPMALSELKTAKKYRGSPTATMSTSMNYTSTHFSAIGIKFVLVEFVISKFHLNNVVEFSICTTQLVPISHSTILSRFQKLY